MGNYNKKKRQKTVAILSMLAIMAALATGCSKKAEEADSKKKEPSITQSAEEQEKEETNEPEETMEPEEMIEPEETMESQETIEPEATDSVEPVANTSSKISDNWKDFEFQFDGQVYKLPTSYSAFTQKKWSTDWSAYGKGERYIVESMHQIMAVSLENPDYPDCMANVGFINKSNKDKDITECDIYSFAMDILSGYEPIGKYPNVTLAKGITFGSTKKEILQAFGEPDTTNDYIKDYGYVQYTYRIGGDAFMILTVYEDQKGLTKIELNRNTW